MLLDYLSAHRFAKLCFYASKMILHVGTDVTFLVEPSAKSRMAWYFYLSNHFHNNSVVFNAAIYVECKLLQNVVDSATEAETGGLFHNCQVAIYIQIIISALGLSQPPTVIKTDNITASLFAINMIKQKQSKSWDMKIPLVARSSGTTAISYILGQSCKWCSGLFY